MLSAPESGRHLTVANGMSTPNSKALVDLREFFAAGLFEEPEASPMWGLSRSVRRKFQRRSLSPYEGTLLYPAGAGRCGREGRALTPSDSFTWQSSQRMTDRE